MDFHRNGAGPVDRHSNRGMRKAGRRRANLAGIGRRSYNDSRVLGKMGSADPSCSKTIGDASTSPCWPVVRAISILFFLAMLAAPGIFAQDEGENGGLPLIPFDALIAGNDTAQIPWEVLAGEWGLTAQQRLRATIEVRIPARQMASRLGTGSLIFMTQITDVQGHAYRNHQGYDLVSLKLPPGTQYLSVSFNAFVLPGDYQVAIAIYDTATKEYSVAHREMRVAAIRNDPLPELWSGLPTVNFWPTRDPMETMQAKLSLPLQTKRRIHVEVLLNTTFTKGVNPSKSLYDHSLTILAPEFETLAQVSPANGKLDAAALELTDRKVLFEQDGVTTLDWQRFADSLVTVNPGVISASSLQNQPREAQYFTDEVLRRISPEAVEPGDGGKKQTQDVDALRVLIVLTGPMSFPNHEALRQISAEGDCECRVYYIRSHTVGSSGPLMPLDDQDQDTALPPARGHTPPELPQLDGSGAPTTPPSDACPANACNYDELENTLAPLRPRVFDVYSPMDFRRALASILSDVAQY
jgi:hypothetical protein